jgi:site-specific DNA recombinase
VQFFVLFDGFQPFINRIEIVSAIVANDVTYTVILERTNVADSSFLVKLPRPEMTDLYKITLSESWYKQTSYLQDDHKSLIREIKEQEEKISYIRDLLSTKQIDPADFREMKTEYTGKLEKLEARLAIRDQGHEDVPGLLDAGIDNLLKLDYIYEDGQIDRKRTVISSMYPEKLTFDGDRLRTNRINEAARIIYTLDKGLDKNEKGQNGNIPVLSSQVGKTALEPKHP